MNDTTLQVQFNHFSQLDIQVLNLLCYLHYNFNPEKYRNFSLIIQ